MSVSAAKLMYETLKLYGVTHLFGMDEPTQLYQEIDKNIIKPITVRDEKHGAIMAHGYAKITNRPGVCTALRGPGATNLISGLAESLKSSIPVLAIVQDTTTKSRGKNSSSEFDNEGLLKTVTKSVEKIDNPKRTPEFTRRAFKIATSGRPGPVAILCPPDVMEAKVKAEVYIDQGCQQYPAIRFRASNDSIKAAADLIKFGKRPVLIAGGGCITSSAWNQVIEIAELFNIPIATTLMGKGTIPDNHPLSIGVMGSATGGKFGRGKIANHFIAEADVVWIIGSRTAQESYMDWMLPKKGAQIIHLDIDPLEIGRNFKTQVPMVGDVRETLIDFIKYCRKSEIIKKNAIGIKKIVEMKNRWRELNKPLSESSKIPIRPERLLKELGKFINDNTVIVTDASYVSMWAMSHIDNVTEGCNIISPRGMAGLGWGLPAAMGVKIGNRDKTVICLTGDGAFGYVINELETASRYGIKVITVVFNNSVLGYQKHYEEMKYGSSVECDLQEIDYAAVAKSLHCEGERILDPSEIKVGLKRALESFKTYVIDVVVDPKVVPPLMMFDEYLDSSSADNQL
jgi:acetolactate synthase-1/2/3 large subunit